MTPVHPNLMLLQQLDLHDPEAAKAVLADDFVWHYINPNLPELEGDYEGVAGFQEFFKKTGERTEGHFQVNPVSALPAGDELLVVHVRNSLVLAGNPIKVDAVVIWRIADGKFVEAWDIPAAHALATVDEAKPDHLYPL